MECPKCHIELDDNLTVCPKCHKVIQLECPNCHSLSESAICSKCGYTILIKCSKCGRMTPVEKNSCKCGFPTLTSIAYQECDSDDIASIIVKFGALKNIKRSLKSKELYTKFFIKLKNLLYSQLKGFECKIISYGEDFVINLNKELSFTTSANKAVRLSLKIINAFVLLNQNVLEEFGTPLNLNLSIIKKSAEKLLEYTTYESNVKPLVIKKDSKKYLKGLQIILDQFVCDEINKEYKTDSLYSLEEAGSTIVFYEIVLGSYILPPSKEDSNEGLVLEKKNIPQKTKEKTKKDLYSFKVFDINAKCSFEKTTATELIEKLRCIDLDKKGKIVSIKTKPEYSIPSELLVDFYKKNDYRVLSVCCTEEMNFKPWGFFEVLFREFFGLSYHNRFIDFERIKPETVKYFKPLFDFIFKRPVKAMTPEDARFAYIEYWGKFLSILNKTVIIVEGFENLDDTSIQTLELYFDKFKTIKPNFLFITSDELSVHSKIKGLLRTPLYTEFKLEECSLESCLATIKSDAMDFIQSFYYEKIKENFNGSFLYFRDAIGYLKENGVLIDFENKLLIKNKKSIILPQSINDLYKIRLRSLSKVQDLSLILAYSSLLGARIDKKTLLALGISDIDKHLEKLVNNNLVRVIDNIVYINNFNLLSPVILKSLNQDAENFIAKNIVAKLGKGLEDSSLALILGKLKMYKDEYLNLWKNSHFALKTGDYDAYLKSCLGFLTLVEHLESNIPQEEIERNKKEVYNNILMCLYSYSPAKIYHIENILLMDAINENNDEKIVQLSNLMLQGALISSNYADALGLLHNILSRTPNPTLLVNNQINNRFLLLSLVNLEILYNIGDFKQCVEIAEEILKVLRPGNLELVKPPGFSTNLFIQHLLETFRLASLAKLYLMDEDIEEFFERIKNALDAEFEEKDCILAIKDYIAGKVYEINNIEEYSAYSKVVFLILQEFSILKDDYKRFAQNIYQAKLLATEIHQRELELFCDLLIAYAYSKIGIEEKAKAIYDDVLENAEKSAMFNLILVARYLLIKLKKEKTSEESLLLINDTLALIQKFNNQSQMMYAVFQNLYIKFAQGSSSVDIEAEELKIEHLKEKLKAILI